MDGLGYFQEEKWPLTEFIWISKHFFQAEWQAECLFFIQTRLPLF